MGSPPLLCCRHAVHDPSFIQLSGSSYINRSMGEDPSVPRLLFSEIEQTLILTSYNLYSSPGLTRLNIAYVMRDSN